MAHSLPLGFCARIPVDSVRSQLVTLDCWIGQTMKGATHTHTTTNSRTARIGTMNSFWFYDNGWITVYEESEVAQHSFINLCKTICRAPLNEHAHKIVSMNHTNTHAVRKRSHLANSPYRTSVSPRDQIVCIAWLGTWHPPHKFCAPFTRAMTLSMLGARATRTVYILIIK